MNNSDLTVSFEQALSIHRERLKLIKVALFDVDGVLTDGQVFWAGQEVGWSRFFHAQDGHGLKMLKKAGIKTGFISGGASLGVKMRAEMLGTDFVYLGSEDKLQAFEAIKLQTGLSDHEFLYMGDEYFDMPLLERVGFSATTIYASLPIQQGVHYIAQRPPGHACAREVIDLLLASISS